MTPKLALSQFVPTDEQRSLPVDAQSASAHLLDSLHLCARGIDSSKFRTLVPVREARRCKAKSASITVSCCGYLWLYRSDPILLSWV